MAITSDIRLGDCLSVLRGMADGSVNCCITSPPYWGLRDYGHDGQLGLEATPEQYVARMVEVFREVRRVLRDDGTLWLNIGDTYCRGDRGTVPPQRGAAASKHEDKKYGFESAAARMGQHPTIKPKDLIGIPWMLAFGLRTDGWYLRQEIIWAKPNPMPESVRDRCTKAHEQVFLLTKTDRYSFNADAIREPEGANKRSVWSISPKGYKGAHFAVMPEALVEPCVRAGCPEGGLVLDPFAGSGTVGVVAQREGRNFVGIELNPEYARLAKDRIDNNRSLLV